MGQTKKTGFESYSLERQAELDATRSMREEYL